MTHESVVVAAGRMEIQHEVAKGSGRHALKRIQHSIPIEWKCLKCHVPQTQLISGILEGHDVMRVARDALGKFAERKHVLAQIEDRDVAVMRMFGENVQHRLVVVALRHQIVHDEQSSSGNHLSNSFFTGMPALNVTPVFFNFSKLFCHDP